MFRPTDALSASSSTPPVPSLLKERATLALDLSVLSQAIGPVCTCGAPLAGRALDLRSVLYYTDEVVRTVGDHLV